MSAQVTNPSGRGEISLIGLLRSSITAKLVAMGILLAIIPALIVGAYSIVNTSALLEQEAITAEHDEALTKAQEINAVLSGVESDILFLTNSSPTQELIRLMQAGDMMGILAHSKKLEADLLYVASAKPWYTQVRFIDPSGQELIRVDVPIPGEPPILVPQEALQNKADRSYFTSTMQLAQGETYVSPLDLNRENGEIEVLPNGEYQPVIRFGAPISDEYGRYGILVINVLASQFLENFKEGVNIDDGKAAFIVNSDGYYLANSIDSSKEWGDPTQLDNGHLFTKDYPQFASLAGKVTMQTLIDDPDHYVTAHPLTSGEGKEPFATLITLRSRNTLLAPVRNFQTILSLILISSVILAGLIGVWLSRRLTKQVHHISNLFDDISIGNYAARTQIVSQDELGRAAEELNSMLDNTLTLIQSQEERDSIQESIFKLLNEVSTVADGDLTVEAEVTSGMTGAIADSFNFMIEQLRDIIINIQQATSEVSQSATHIQTTTTHLAIGSETQATQIIDTSAAIDEMSLSIQQVSENAALSATVGEQSRNNAQLGAQAVAATVDSMTRIREQVEITAEHLARLDASSREIDKITKLINQISERTSILAINASIQASEAGEAGRGFAVVAAEVERLSDRSALASAQINQLTRAIQQDVNKAVDAMESTSNEVVSGSNLANEAGDKLSEIELVSSQLSDLIQSISLASKQQARGSGAIAYSMNEIAQVTQQTANGTKQANVSIGNLATLADELRESVSQFKINVDQPNTDMLEMI